MPIGTRLLLLAFFCAISSQIFAQSIVVTAQNPDQLYVCGQDVFEITVKNTTAAPLTNLKVTLSLPPGVEYIPGSISMAAEFNLANLNAPVFALADLPVGAMAVLSGQETATCSVVAAINSGQLFNNIITVAHAGGNQQVSSQNYPVETGLLFISSVAPVTQSGQNGQVLTRTITIGNSRQGPISSLQFSDQHFPGLSIQLVGIGGSNNAPILFEATVPGSYFTAFGDGDELLEVNETVTLTEQITVEDCGIPSYSNPSTIQVGWGCGDEICQSDVKTAEVTILPSGESSILQFVPVYAPPISQCADEPASQELLIINTGTTAAEDLLISLLANDTVRLGLDYQSVAYQAGAGWIPLTPLTGQSQLLPACGATGFYSKLNLGLPPIPAGDTVRLRFDTYFCQPVCDKEEVGVTGLYFYQSACPNSPGQNGYIVFEPDTLATALTSGVYFDIGDCIADNSVQTFGYWIKSQRLLHDTGYLRFEMKLPWGLFWQADCLPSLGGQAAVLVKVDTVLNEGTTLRLAFQLPMSLDSVFGEFCLLNICQAPATYSPSIPEPPTSGNSYTVYPVAPPCSPCIQQVETITSISTTPNVAESCGITSCNGYELVLDCGCADAGAGGGPPGEGALVIADYDAWRINVGLRDDDDDRMADDGSPANPTIIRRDRFLPGDTLRTQLRGTVDEGQVTALSFRIFNESWLSDFGMDGGDEFNLRAGQFPFTNADSLRYIGGSLFLTIAATGAQYECPINTASRADRNYLQIAPPNIWPQEPYDQIITMFHQFNLSLPELAATGCVPAGLTLQPGDSLIFHGDFVFRQNFTPEANSIPPLINFRSAICGSRQPFAWKLQNCFPPLLRQYSGYKEYLRPPVYSILPCTTSTELFPFRYTLRIARENLFPNEVRPLAWLSNYSHTLPSVTLLETRLKFLRLQENTPMFSDQILPITQANNELQINLDPFFANPLDEGFALEIGSIFAPSCAFTGTLQTTTRVQVRYPNAGFHDPTVRLAELPNLTGYNSAAPQLSLVLEDSVIKVSTDQLALEFFLRNLAPAASPNTWLTVSTPGNALGNVEIVLLPSGQTVPLIGGVFQLGSLMGFNQPQFRLRGALNVCDPVTVTFTYGWDCDPVTNLAGQPCRTYTKTIRLVPRSPELELVVVQQPVTVPMCAPSEHFIFEIYNAAEGRAYSPVGSIKLPFGLMVLAGSSQLSYPDGAAWAALPDPVAIAGNVYEWSPILPNGLLPFASAPQNGLRIRFRVIASCGFVANSQPIYGADCRQPCGLASNRLRKPHLPLQLNGLDPDYTVNTALTLATPNSSTDCGETTALSAALTVGGTPTAGDSIYLILPAGISYVASSYQPGPNAPSGPPQVTSQGIQLPLPAGAAGTEIRFTFGIRYDDTAGCGDQSVLLQTRQKGQAFCPLTNQNCSVYVATGEAILFLSTQNAELLLQDFTATAADNGVTYSAVLKNAGAGTVSNPVVQFFLDQNHNGKMDVNEPLVGTQQTNGTLASQALLVIGGSLPLTPAQLCDLAALIPADANCACTDQIISLGSQAIIRQAIGLCGLAAVPLQVDSTTGSIYTWLTPAGLGCTTCAQTSYTPPSDVQSGDLITLVLVEKTGNCSVQHEFDLQFGGTLGVETQDQTVCQGGSVALKATPGGTYVWSGPGVTNPTLATQVLQPTQNANYSVTVTFAGGCTGIGQVTVTVLPRDSVDLGVRTTCVGLPIDIFGQITEKPGVYSQTLLKANGCDSVLYLRLALQPNETSEVRPLCAGDSTMVFDSLFHQAGSLCETFSSALGCDSTHCVTVTAVANPIIPAQDSVIIELGQEIMLDGPDGFAEYVWLPTAGLSCNTCADPLAKPDSTTNYLLIVADGNGCVGSVQYRVLVFPPCDPKRLLVPNAFTPNGDNVNDTFTVVPFEGLESVLELTIYDRWGEKVYVGSGRTAAWDGTIGGKPAPSDVYVWRLVVDCNGERTPLTMDVTLLR